MGGSKLYYVKFDGWHKVPAETPQASHGEGTEGGQWPPLRRNMKCSRSDSKPIGTIFQPFAGPNLGPFSYMYINF